MILDNARQRELILQLIESAQFSGQAIDEAYHLKLAITNAKTKE